MVRKGREHEFREDHGRGALELVSRGCTGLAKVRRSSQLQTREILSAVHMGESGGKGCPLLFYVCDAHIVVPCGAHQSLQDDWESLETAGMS